MSEKIVAVLPNGKAIACRDIPIDPIWVAMNANVRAARQAYETAKLALEAAHKAQTDYADAIWHRAMAEPIGKADAEWIEAEVMAQTAAADKGMYVQSASGRWTKRRA